MVVSKSKKVKENKMEEPLGLGPTPWVEDLEAVNVNDEMWDCYVGMLVETSPESATVAHHMNEASIDRGSRWAFRTISIASIASTVKVNCLKGGDFSPFNILCEEVKNIAGKHFEKPIPTNMLASLIKYEILRLKAIDIEKGGKGVISSPDVPSPDKTKGKEPQVHKPKEVAKEASVKDESKVNTILHKRGQERKDIRYEEDWRVEGPDMLFLISTFYDPDLPLEMIKIGIPFCLLLRMNIQSNPETDTTLASLAKVSKFQLPFSDRFALKPEVEFCVRKYELDCFWSRILSQLWHPNLYLKFEDLIYASYIPELPKSGFTYKDVIEFQDKLYNELSSAMQDVFRVRCMHEQYLENARIINIPKMEALPEPILYKQILNSVPFEAQDVPVILDTIIAQVCMYLSDYPGFDISLHGLKCEETEKKREKVGEVRCALDRLNIKHGMFKNETIPVNERLGLKSEEKKVRKIVMQKDEVYKNVCHLEFKGNFVRERTAKILKLFWEAQLWRKKFHSQVDLITTSNFLRNLKCRVVRRLGSSKEADFYLTLATIESMRVSRTEKHRNRVNEYFQILTDTMKQENGTELTIAKFVIKKLCELVDWNPLQPYYSNKLDAFEEMSTETLMHQMYKAAWEYNIIQVAYNPLLDANVLCFKDCSKTVTWNVTLATPMLVRDFFEYTLLEEKEWATEALGDLLQREADTFVSELGELDEESSYDSSSVSPSTSETDFSVFLMKETIGQKSEGQEDNFSLFGGEDLETLKQSHRAQKKVKKKESMNILYNIDAKKRYSVAGNYRLFVTSPDSNITIQFYYELYCLSHASLEIQEANHTLVYHTSLEPNHGDLEGYTKGIFLPATFLKLSKNQGTIAGDNVSIEFSARGGVDLMLWASSKPRALVMVRHKNGIILCLHKTFKEDECKGYKDNLVRESYRRLSETGARSLGRSGYTLRGSLPSALRFEAAPLRQWAPPGGPETYRYFLPSGQLICFMSDKSIRILSLNGSIVFIPSRDIAVQEEDTKSVPSVSIKSSSLSESLLNKLFDESGTMKSLQHWSITPDGRVYKKEGNLPSVLDSVLLSEDKANVFSDMMWTEREDGTVFKYYNDGSLLVELPNGTKLTTFAIFTDNQVCEDTWDFVWVVVAWWKIEAPGYITVSSMEDEGLYLDVDEEMKVEIRAEGTSFVELGPELNLGINNQKAVFTRTHQGRVLRESQIRLQVYKSILPDSLRPVVLLTCRDSDGRVVSVDTSGRIQTYGKEWREEEKQDSRNFVSSYDLSGAELLVGEVPGRPSLDLQSTTKTFNSLDHRSPSDTLALLVHQSIADSLASLVRQKTTVPLAPFYNQRSTDFRASFDRQKSTDFRASFDRQKSIDFRASFDRQKSIDYRASFDSQKSINYRASMDRQKSIDYRASLDHQKSIDYRAFQRVDHASTFLLRQRIADSSAFFLHQLHLSPLSPVPAHTSPGLYSLPSTYGDDWIFPFKDLRSNIAPPESYSMRYYCQFERPFKGFWNILNAFLQDFLVELCETNKFGTKVPNEEEVQEPMHKFDRLKRTLDPALADEIYSEGSSFTKRPTNKLRNWLAEKVVMHSARLALAEERIRCNFEKMKPHRRALVQHLILPYFDTARGSAFLIITQVLETAMAVIEMPRAEKQICKILKKPINLVSCSPNLGSILVSNVKNVEHNELFITKKKDIFMTLEKELEQPWLKEVAEEVLDDLEGGPVLED